MAMGRIDEAIENFQKAAELNPADASISNNLGVLYYSKGLMEEAEASFRKAVEIEPNHADALYGLGKVYQEYAKTDGSLKQALEQYISKLRNRIAILYERGKTEEAWEISNKLLKLSPDDAENQNDCAVLCYKLGRIEVACKAIDKAKEALPEDADIQENYQIIHEEGRELRAKSVIPAYAGKEALSPMRKKRLAFFCGPNDRFLGDIITHLSQKYEVERFHGKTVQEIHSLMKWSDISWFEWCDNLVIHASKLPKLCKVVCRLHSYEAFTNMPLQVNWRTVDDLVFVAPHIREIVVKQLPNLDNEVDIHVIYNGVDLERHSFKERRKGFNIAYVGYINHKKNPSLLLQCIRHLVDIDDRYVLHIAGQHQELRFQLYFEHMIREMKLNGNAVLYGWVDDIDSWLDAKHFILSTSALESFGYAIAEAMASGLKPLIHNFVGAKELYPEKYLFNSVKEFGERVLSNDYNSAEYRKHIEDNYSLERQLGEIERLLESE